MVLVADDSLTRELLALNEEFARRIRNGSLSHPEEARETLRRIVDGFDPLLSSRGDVEVAPARSQITTMKAFLERFGKGRRGYRPCDIPRTPRKKRGVMLVAHLPGRDGNTSTQRTVEAWWNFFVTTTVPADFAGECDINTGPKYLKSLQDAQRSPGVYWVECGRTEGQHALQALELWGSPTTRDSLAGIEVIMEVVHSQSLQSQRVYLPGLQARRVQRDRWQQMLVLEAQIPAKKIVLRGISAHGITLTSPALIVKPL